MKVILSVIASLGLVLVGSAFAQANPADDGCAAVLTPTEVVVKKDVYARLAYASAVDKQTYEALSKKAGYLASLFPDSLELNYEKAKKSSSSVRERHNLDWEHSDESFYLFKIVDADARRLFVECKKVKAKNRDGLHAWLFDITANEVTVMAFWQPSPLAPRPVSLTYSRKNVVAVQSPSSIRAYGYRLIKVTRDPSIDGSLSIEAEGVEPAFIKIPKDPPKLDEPLWCQQQLDLPLVATAHVAHSGNMAGVEGAIAGRNDNTGITQALKAEFRKKWPNPIPELGLEYRCHVARYGWQSYVTADQWCFDEKRDSSVEAVEMRLTGANKEHFKLEYWCRLRHIGWIGPFRDGATCGTVGQSRPLQAFKINISSLGICKK